MKITGYHITEDLIVNSEGETCQHAPWLDILFKENGESIKVLYHMDYSVACLLKMISMPKSTCEELLATNDTEYNNYKFEYIPGSWFAIRDKQTRQWAGFSNMTQYANSTLEPTCDKIGDAIDFAFQAERTGRQVYSVLTKFGLHPTSLTSPISAYNKEILSQIDLPTCDDSPDEVTY